MCRRALGLLPVLRRVGAILLPIAEAAKPGSAEIDFAFSARCAQTQLDDRVDTCAARGRIACAGCGSARTSVTTQPQVLPWRLVIVRFGWEML